MPRLNLSSRLRFRPWDAGTSGILTGWRGITAGTAVASTSVVSCVIASTVAALAAWALAFCRFGRSGGILGFFIGRGLLFLRHRSEARAARRGTFPSLHTAMLRQPEATTVAANVAGILDEALGSFRQFDLRLGHLHLGWPTIEVTTNFTTSKVDGATLMYWLIMAPY